MHWLEDLLQELCHIELLVHGLCHASAGCLRLFRFLLLRLWLQAAMLPYSRRTA